MKNRPVPAYSFGAIAQRGKLFPILCALALSISACGGGGGSSSSTPPPPPPPPSSFTIGGSVINLAGSNGGLQVEDNGVDTLAVNANGAFTFKMAVADRSAYDVTVSAQPTSPAQNCEVTNGTGTATANVTNVQVDCGHGEWTWMGGSNVVNQSGIYGTKGTPAASNIPGARSGSVAWVDKSGNVWLFGGLGCDSAATCNFDLNDLWEYSNGEWTWKGGSNLAAQPGVYGTKGTPSANNIPGARAGAVTWTDSSGNVWLFGGDGYDSTGAFGYLNDLWKYSNGEWTWMSGSNTVNQDAVYGTVGVPSLNNTPGGRNTSLSWVDSSGHLWLFGGYGYGGTGSSLNYLGDFWQYSLSSGEWTWMGSAPAKGVYGTLGTPAAGNIPGPRDSSATWTDSAGNLWLFGGDGYDSAANIGVLNDLWKYSLGSGEWTWMGGADVINQSGKYGTEGTPSASNIPGARANAVIWTDSSGNVWLFGGLGLDSVGHGNELNDLWKYSPATGEWTWMSGSDLANQIGTYGTQGTPFPGNVPGGRDSAVSWIDAQGNLWLFGGQNPLLVIRGFGFFNDLWKYEP